VVKSPESRAGTIGWIGLGAGVLAFDVLAPETLTSAYGRYLERPVSRIIAVGALAVTAAHLVGALPNQVDPFVQFSERLLK